MAQVDRSTKFRRRNGEIPRDLVTELGRLLRLWCAQRPDVALALSEPVDVPGHGTFPSLAQAWRLAGELPTGDLLSALLDGGYARPEHLALTDDEIRWIAEGEASNGE